MASLIQVSPAAIPRTSSPARAGRLRSAAVALLLLAQAALAGAVELSASVDRKKITLEDSVTLTIRINEQSSSGRPDFSELGADFELLSAPSERSQYQVINGRVSSFTQWQIQLAPKRVGKLLIPSFEYRGAFSDAIEITVLDPVAGRRGNQADIFLEAEIGKSAVYVQEQLILNVRLFTSVTLQSVKSQDIRLPGARVEEIADHRYQRNMAGKTYAVVESVYAVFPQSSGELTIPALTWSVTTAGNRSSFFGPSGGSIKRLRSQPLNVEVRPRPATYPADQPWLPAEDVALVQSWNRNPDAFTVGEPITRTLELSARGLTAAQLPPLPAGNIDSIKVYPEQPQSEDFKSADGIRGVRVESQALVPTQPGQVTLPAVVVTWWDTANDRQREITLPPQVIDVAPAAATGTVAAMTPAATAPAPGSTVAAPITTAGSLWAWQVATALSALLALLFAWLWRRAAGPQSAAPADTPRGNAVDTEAKAFQQLRATCSNGEPRAIRRALLQWAQLYWQEPHLTRIADLAARLADDEASACCAELEALLYAENSGSGNVRQLCNTLLACLARLRAQRPAAAKASRRGADPALPELYAAG
ncbi:BatD family protein [Exilibacterium tricleocarpae]|uniref:BatD family protein n=1 Tax=Exilibacterium tricleocarpae TaxID=2591008 RepID=UPI001FE2BEE2|nr:BatD family protein [Exilibacterium tricleocarpae]